MKRTLIVVAFVLIAIASGWIWGAWGRWAAERSRDAAELRRALFEARGAILEARLDIYAVNFGNASQHFESARDLLRDAQERLRAAGRQEDARLLDQALSRVDEAQRMAGNLDQAANSRASTVVTTIDEVLGTSER